MSSMNIVANPESAFESGLRIFGALLAVMGAVELYGLYGISNPTHWLSNLSISISDNSFRTLSMFGIIALIVGAALFMRKGVFMILGILVIVILWQGHGKWYTIGHGKFAVKSAVSAPAMGTSLVAVEPVATETAAASIITPTTDGFIDTGIAMTAAEKAWCAKDDDEDGKMEATDNDGFPNWKNSNLSAKNCASGNVHTLVK